MANFIEAVGESVNRAACVVLGGLAGQEELLRYVLEPLQTGNPGYNGLGALYAERCDTPPPGRQPPPFTGGQCVGTNYQITFTVDYVTGVSPPNTENSTPENGSLVRVGAILSFNIENNANNCGYRIVTTAGSEFLGRATFPTNNKQELRNLRNLVVTPLYGGANNCGNPDPIPPVLPPNGNTYNDNTTFINNEGDTVSIPISVTLGYAQVNFNGQVSIPVSVNFSANPELNFEGDYNLNTGDININVGNPAIPRPGKDGTKDNYTVPDTPAAPDEIPPEIPSPDPEPESEYESLIRAAVVTTTEWLGQETVIFQDINPNIYAPSLGYISFLIDVGGVQAWTNDIPVKNRRAFIECPWAPGAIDVRGTPRPGNNFVVSPVYVASTVQPTYPA